MAYLGQSELSSLGLRACGTDVLVSTKASFYHPERIELGDHVRIDDHVIITAGADGFVRIGSHVFVGAYCMIEGITGVTLEDFTCLSARGTVLSESDDYSGEHLTGPTVPMSLRGTHNAPVHIGRHVIIGAGCVILPGTVIGDGAAVGAMSLVKGEVESGVIYAGIPAVRVRARSGRVHELERQLSEEARFGNVGSDGGHDSESVAPSGR